MYSYNTQVCVLLTVYTHLLYQVMSVGCTGTATYRQNFNVCFLELSDKSWGLYNFFFSTFLKKKNKTQQQKPFLIAHLISIHRIPHS